MVVRVWYKMGLLETYGTRRRGRGRGRGWCAHYAASSVFWVLSLQCIVSM